MKVDVFGEEYEVKVDLYRKTPCVTVIVENEKGETTTELMNIHELKRIVNELEKMMADKAYEELKKECGHDETS